MATTGTRRTAREVMLTAAVFLVLAIGFSIAASPVPCTAVNIAEDWCPGVTGTLNCNQYSPTGSPPACSGSHKAIQKGWFADEEDDDYCAYIRPSIEEVPCTKTYPCKVTLDGMNCEDSLNADPMLTTTKGAYRRVDCEPEDCEPMDGLLLRKRGK